MCQMMQYMMNMMGTRMYYIVNNMVAGMHDILYYTGCRSVLNYTLYVKVDKLYDYSNRAGHVFIDILDAGRVALYDILYGSKAAPSHI